MKSKGPRNLIAVAVLAMVGVVALATYVKFTPADRLNDEEKRPGMVKQEPAKPQTDVTVPQPEFHNNELSFKPVKTPVKPNANTKAEAVNGFLGKFNALKNVKIEKIEMDGNVARVYFPESANLSFGGQDEATFLLGLRSALGQFGDVEAVELYWGGQKVDSLGHIELDAPMPIIRPEKWASPTKSSAAQVP